MARYTMAMRILFYNHAGEISGAERVLLDVMEHTRAAGHTVLLCAPPGSLVDEAHRAGLPVRPVAQLTIGYARNPLMLARYLARAVVPLLDLARAVQRFHPDVVHANSIRSGVIAVLALRYLYRPPRLAVHMHDALGRGRLDRLVANMLAGRTDSVVAISRYVARSLSVDRDKSHVVYNAVDLERYRHDDQAGWALRERLGIPLQAPVLAVVGQITPWKGQREAIEALALVRQRHPDARLLVAGSIKFAGAHRRYDNGAYHAQLVQRAGQPDVAGFVHLLGEVEDTAAVYAAATALLAPSWAEPFGRVVIEAMAAGCPVIATAAGGIPEIITDGVDGLLVPPKDPSALAHAVERLLDDPSLRQALIQNGGATVTRRFAVGEYVPRLLDIWGLAHADGPGSS